MTIQVNAAEQYFHVVLFRMPNLVPRAHVHFGQHQDTELWNNQFPETKILGLPASRRMRGLVYMASRDKVDLDTFHKGIQYALEKLGKSRFVYVIAWARGQLRINFTSIFKVSTKRAIWKTLKIQVKLILNCMRALAITCLSHAGQHFVH